MKHYDIVLDITGQFRGTNELSANVGFVLKNEDAFFLSKEVKEVKDGKTYYNAAINTEFIIDNVLLTMKNLVNDDKEMSYDSFLLYLDGYNENDRTSKQGNMLAFYKNLLNTLNVSNWEVLAISHRNSVLQDAIVMGEASAINYLESLISGLIEYYFDEYVKNSKQSVPIFNVGIVPWIYKIPVRGKYYIGGKQQMDFKSKALNNKQITNFFNDYLRKNFNRKLSELLKHNIRFYQLNGYEPKDKVSNFDLRKNGFGCYSADTRRLAEQIVMSVSGTLANSYRHKDLHEKFFKSLTDDRKYITYGNSMYSNSLGFKQCIIEKDYEKFIKNAIFFPSIKIEKSDAQNFDYWVTQYQKLQKGPDLKRIIKDHVIPGVLNYNKEKKIQFFNNIKDCIKESIKNNYNNREEGTKWVYRLESLVNLYENIPVSARDEYISKFGADLYLFLANRYMNIGKTEEAALMLDKAIQLKDYWEDEQELVYATLKFVELNQKFQYELLEEDYKNVLLALHNNKRGKSLLNCMKSVGDVNDYSQYSTENLENLGKVHGLYLESLIGRASRSDIYEHVFGQVCLIFKTWKERKYIYSHYIRVLLSNNKTDLAYSYLLRSLKLEYDIELQKNENKVYVLESCRKALIVPEDFFETISPNKDSQNSFRAFVFLNYLTVVRELLKRQELNYILREDVLKIIENKNIINAVSGLKPVSYPYLLINWRLAEIYSLLSGSNLEKANSYYKIMDVYFDNHSIDSNSRLMAIKMSVLASYNIFLIEHSIGNCDDLVELKNEILESYKKFRGATALNNGIIKCWDLFGNYMLENEGNVLSVQTLHSILGCTPFYY